MKYLKRYNESSSDEFSLELLFTQEEIDNIKDIFTDIIDEYNLTDATIGKSVTSFSNLLYLLHEMDSGEYVIISHPEIVSMYIKYNKQDKNLFLDDMEKFKTRVESLGHKFIIDDKFNNVSIFKISKY